MIQWYLTSDKIRIDTKRTGFVVNLLFLIKNLIKKLMQMNASFVGWSSKKAIDSPKGGLHHEENRIFVTMKQPYGKLQTRTISCAGNCSNKIAYLHILHSLHCYTVLRALWSDYSFTHIFIITYSMECAPDISLENSCDDDVILFIQSEHRTNAHKNWIWAVPSWPNIIRYCERCIIGWWII